MKNLSLIPFLLAAMTISVPILYLIGYFYNLGYLSVFGLSNEYLSYSIYDHLVQAFVVFLNLSTTLVNLLNNNLWKLLFLAALVALLLFFLVYMAKHPDWIISKANKMSEWKYLDYVTIPSAGAFITFIIPYGAIVGLFALCVIPVTAFWQGERDAGGNMLNYRGCDLEKRSVKDSCIRVNVTSDNVIEGMYIAQSDSHIALWNGISTEIIPFKDTILTIKFGHIPSEDSPRSKAYIGNPDGKD